MTHMSQVFHHFWPGFPANSAEYDKYSHVANKQYDNFINPLYSCIHFYSIISALCHINHNPFWLENTKVLALEVTQMLPIV